MKRWNISGSVSYEKLSGIESQIKELLTRFTEEVKQKNGTAVVKPLKIYIN